MQRATLHVLCAFQKQSMYLTKFWHFVRGLALLLIERSPVDEGTELNES